MIERSKAVPLSRDGFSTSASLRVLTSGLLVLAAAATGCAPVDDVPMGPAQGAGGAPIPDTPITEAEQAAGVQETGQDYAEPGPDTDGNLAALAPRLDQAGGADGDAYSTFIEASTACSPAQGYNRGNPVRICVVSVDGKLAEVNTAQAWRAMKAHAAREGVSLSLNSGFRTMDQQRYLYNLYLSGRGNLAARPGYSNHQSGLALDISTGGGALAWLNRNGSRYGFRRTVPSEPWHWERPAGSQSSTNTNASGGGTRGDTCYSQTLGRTMDNGVCVQSRFDEIWYYCYDGAWYQGRRGCTQSFPLGSTSTPTPTAPAGCHSSTLNRTMAVGTCLQSRFDSLWYQCSTIGWMQNSAIPSTRRGYAGACTQYLPR